VDADYHKMHSQLIHRHQDVLELLYVISGSGRYVVNNREYFVQAGNLVICNEGIFHGEYPFEEKEMTSICCVLDQVNVQGLKKNNIISNSDIPVLFFREDREDFEMILRSIQHLYEKNSRYQSVCEKLSQAVLEMVLLKIEKRRKVNVSTHKKNNELLQDVSKYLDEHFMDGVTLTDLEEKFHISKYALLHIFQSNTGISPMKYVMYRKIGESQNLLMNTKMLISEVAEKLNFNDNSHFSAAFKKYVGMTPKEYRKHFQTDK
jgi:AraC-like DNA-binding protein